MWGITAKIHGRWHDAGKAYTSKDRAAADAKRLRKILDSGQARVYRKTAPQKTKVVNPAGIKVSDYSMPSWLRTAAGKRGHVRKATQVRFPDGRVVRFSEKLSKKRAIAQALEALKRHPEHFPRR